MSCRTFLPKEFIESNYIKYDLLNFNYAEILGNAYKINDYL